MPRIIDAFTQFFDDNGDPLVNGKLKFVVSGTNNTDKDTFADINETIPNSNPVDLGGDGRCPNVFGTGSYNVISYASNGVQIQQFDPVGGDRADAALDAWDAITIYSSGDIVTASDGLYYRSIVSANENQDPTTSPDKWEEIKFIPTWNTNIEYSTGDAVSGSDGFHYTSRTDTNTGNNPTTDTTNWRPGTDGKLPKGADIASATALTLGDDGQFFDVTGTTTITSIGSKGVGTYIILQFDDVLTLTHNATDLVLPNGADIITYAGYIITLYEYASGDFTFISDNQKSELPPNYISGLILSNDADTDHDINITAGDATDSGNTVSMSLASEITKQIDAEWAVGDDAGGMSPITTETGDFTTVGTAVTGVGTLFASEYIIGDILYSDSKVEGRRVTAIATNIAMTVESAFTTDVSVADAAKRNGLAPNTWYHTSLIQKDSDSSNDVFFDVSVTAANIPSGYTAFRRIGSVLTDGSANIIQFYQNGNEFLWKIPEVIFAATAPTTRTEYTMSTPLGTECLAHVEMRVLSSTIQTNGLMRIYSPHATDAAVTNSNANFTYRADSTTGESNTTQISVLTNTSSQMSFRSNASINGVGANISRYTDFRGQN